MLFSVCSAVFEGRTSSACSPCLCLNKVRSTIDLVPGSTVVDMHTEIDLHAIVLTYITGNATQRCALPSG